MTEGSEIPDVAVPFSEIPVTAPLALWPRQCFVDAEELNAGTGRSPVLSLIAGPSGFTLTLVVLARLLYRDFSRVGFAWNLGGLRLSVRCLSIWQ